MNYSPAKTLILFFLGLITAGTVLLSLPVARNPQFEFSLLTNLFTATSASCVTGLSVVPIGEFFSLFGQTVIMLLMQLGGLGYMFVSTVVTLLIGKMALKDRRMMQELFDISSFNDLKKLLTKAVAFVLTIELIGAIILTFVFMREFSFLKSCYLGVFHSISAFCNAGFTPFTDSLAGYSNVPVMLYTMIILIVLGGLGFFVIVDLYDTYKNKRLHLTTHAKVVLSLTAAIIAFGLVFFNFSEASGPFGVLKNKDVFYAFNNSLFQAVSARTAGFYTIPAELFNQFTKVILIFLMSIGAAPGSTAGGLKITTLALVFVFVRSMLQANNDFVLFKKRMPDDLIKKALTIFIVYFSAIAFFSALLVLFESSKQPIDVVFEAVSAFGTVGLSVGVTPGLSVAGKIVTILAMITGRIGILTVLILMITSSSKKESVRYPESRILVG